MLITNPSWPGAFVVTIFTSLRRMVWKTAYNYRVFTHAFTRPSLQFGVMMNWHAYG
jgi:hypothetical protein